MEAEIDQFEQEQKPVSHSLLLIMEIDKKVVVTCCF